MCCSFGGSKGAVGKAMGESTGISPRASLVRRLLGHDRQEQASGCVRAFHFGVLARKLGTESRDQMGDDVLCAVLPL